MNKLIKTTIAASVLASSSAMAGDIVSEWDYMASLVFNTAETTTTNGVIHTNTEGQLVWGIPASVADGGDGETRSSLTIHELPGTTPDTMVEGTTSGGVGIGNSMTHDNWPIYKPYLTSGQLIDNLTLKLDGETIYTADTLTLNFNFLETINSGDCAADTGLDGWGGDDSNEAYASCPDLWAIDPEGSSSLAPQFFQHDEITYALQVVLFDELMNPLLLSDQLLLDEECAALELDNGCVGFRTGENEQTTRTFGFLVSAVPVPAAVWLFGSALLGFVGYNRRKNRA